MARDESEGEGAGWGRRVKEGGEECDVKRGGERSGMWE